MPRTVDWPVYHQLVGQLLTVVGEFVNHERVDYETMLAVLVLFQASVLAGPAVRVQKIVGDLEAFLTQYTEDVARMVRIGVERAQDLQWGEK
jgi:hypothetical protein